MQKIKDTISIWWKYSSTPARLAGVWVTLVLTFLLLFLLFTGIILKVIMVIVVVGIPTATIILAFYTVEGLMEANKQRKKAERLRRAYSHRGPEFRHSEDF